MDMIGRLNETGLYRHQFVVPETWKGKTIHIVFEGVMTDTEVKINGRSAGEMHQGGFYCFEYDITKLLKFGQNNLLEVTVHKSSSNESVEKPNGGGFLGLWGYLSSGMA